MKLWTLRNMNKSDQSGFKKQAINFQKNNCYQAKQHLQIGMYSGRKYLTDSIQQLHKLIPTLLPRGREGEKVVSGVHSLSFSFFLFPSRISKTFFPGHEERKIHTCVFSDCKNSQLQGVAFTVCLQRAPFALQLQGLG